MAITAKILKDSRSGTNRLTTLEIEFPRWILSELNTHRMLSKNSASSRAIPASTMINQILNDPAMPVFWGKNKPGMSAVEELSPEEINKCKNIWYQIRDDIVGYTEELISLGLHKQILNRPSEVFHTMKTVISGTEWKNFFHLRYHSAAQPEFYELAKAIRRAFDDSEPDVLNPGEYHLPYILTERNSAGRLVYKDSTGVEISLETAIKLSVSCCAQVSYRKLDESVEKAISIYDMLISMDVTHASPFEHVGTPIDLEHIYTFDPITWEEGITHVRSDGSIWSGNFQGWIQYRQLIPNNTVW